MHDLYTFLLFCHLDLTQRFVTFLRRQRVAKYLALFYASLTLNASKLTHDVSNVTLVPQQAFRTIDAYIYVCHVTRCKTKYRKNIKWRNMTLEDFTPATEFIWLLTVAFLDEEVTVAKKSFPRCSVWSGHNDWSVNYLLAVIHRPTNKEFQTKNCVQNKTQLIILLIFYHTWDIVLARERLMG